MDPSPPLPAFDGDSFSEIDFKYLLSNYMGSGSLRVASHELSRRRASHRSAHAISRRSSSAHNVRSHSADNPHANALDLHATVVQAPPILHERSSSVHNARRHSLDSRVADLVAHHAVADNADPAFLPSKYDLNDWTLDIAALNLSSDGGRVEFAAVSPGDLVLKTPPRPTVSPIPHKDAVDGPIDFTINLGKYMNLDYVSDEQQEQLGAAFEKSNRVEPAATLDPQGTEPPPPETSTMHGREQKAKGNQMDPNVSLPGSHPPSLSSGSQTSTSNTSSTPAMQMPGLPPRMMRPSMTQQSRRKRLRQPLDADAIQRMSETFGLDPHNLRLTLESRLGTETSFTDEDAVPPADLELWDESSHDVNAPRDVPQPQGLGLSGASSLEHAMNVGSRDCESTETSLLRQPLLGHSRSGLGDVATVTGPEAALQQSQDTVAFKQTNRDGQDADDTLQSQALSDNVSQTFSDTSCAPLQNPSTHAILQQIYSLHSQIQQMQVAAEQDQKEKTLLRSELGKEREAREQLKAHLTQQQTERQLLDEQAQRDKAQLQRRSEDYLKQRDAALEKLASQAELTNTARHESENHQQALKDAAYRCESLAEERHAALEAAQQAREDLQNVRHGMDTKRSELSETQREFVSLRRENQQNREDARQRDSEMRKLCKALERTRTALEHERATTDKASESKRRHRDERERWLRERDLMTKALFHEWGKQEIGEVVVDLPNGQRQRRMGYRYKYH